MNTNSDSRVRLQFLMTDKKFNDILIEVNARHVSERKYFFDLLKDYEKIRRFAKK